MEQYFAHSKENTQTSEWQLLRDHLQNTAELAKSFAASFHAEDFAYCCGMLHDLGKYSKPFQDYLISGQDNRNVADRDHSTAGAQVAVKLNPFGIFCAYAIAGHHAGLMDWYNGSNKAMSTRMKKLIPDWKCDEADEVVLSQRLPKLLPQKIYNFINNLQQSASPANICEKELGWEFALFTRLLFSCLVDADYLDTERFLAEKISASRPTWPDDVFNQMDSSLQRFSQCFDSISEIAKIRNEIRDDCEKAAELSPGFFTLTVPTGGGKTLSSLSFAIKHAIEYKKQRIIYVVPYISIIEQNADVFKKVFRNLNPNPVLEVHCNMEYDINKQDEETRSLGSENFDAPLVVTTAVQFYESFFAAHSSRCRKLHNLVNSVVIFDEVQKVPVDFLSPIMRLWKSLVQIYDCSLVLCTATQPEIWENQYFKNGLPSSWKREIISPHLNLFDRMKRTDINWIGEINDISLVEKLSKEDSVLCVVNTISHAIKLAKMLVARGNVFCLTTRLYAEHRTKDISEIRERLKEGQKCCVISTSLIEAGVDFDFPVVYRACAGIDSIAQAAGRCNREGKMPQNGQVYVFVSEHQKREQYLKNESNITKELNAVPIDMLSPDIVRQYFYRYYRNRQTDQKFISDDFVYSLNGPRFQFEQAETDFHLIDDISTAVVVPVPEISNTIEQLRNAPFADYRQVRHLQRYSVNIPNKLIAEHLANNDIMAICSGSLLVLTNPEQHYDKLYGLCFENNSDGIFI